MVDNRLSISFVATGFHAIAVDENSKIEPLMIHEVRDYVSRLSYKPGTIFSVHEFGVNYPSWVVSVDIPILGDPTKPNNKCEDGDEKLHTTIEVYGTRTIQELEFRIRQEYIMRSCMSLMNGLRLMVILSFILMTTTVFPRLKLVMVH